jgi:rhodanese-related sulfurtransferase
VDGNVFTGDALFVGGAGRTDFPGGSSSELFDSFRRYEALADDTVVHPGHDYQGTPTSTIGAEKSHNALLKADRDGLAKQMDVRGPAPANMMQILAFNKQGPDDTNVGPVELENLLKLTDPVQVIDIRNPSEFAAEKLGGARNIPLGTLGGRLGEIDRTTPVVVMCNTGVRTLDGARRLRDAGFQVRALEGGINAWKAAGFPVEGAGGLSIERQTQLTIGVMVLLGAALSLWVSPWFLIIPAFFGAGLTFAGATGTCGLAFMLSKMPWNRRLVDDGAACAVGGSACAVGGGAPETACAVGGGVTE